MPSIGLQVSSEQMPEYKSYVAFPGTSMPTVILDKTRYSIGNRHASCSGSYVNFFAVKRDLHCIKTSVRYT